MRVLFVNGHYLPHVGGLEMFTARLAAGLIARGHEVAVAASRFPITLSETETINGVAVHRFPFLQALVDASLSPAGRLRLVGEATAGVRRLKQVFRPDVVHVNVTDASPLFHIRTLDAQPAATVATFHTPLDARMRDKQGVLKALVAAASRLTTVTRTCAANIAAATGIPESSIAVVPPGVPDSDFPALQRQHRPDGGPPTLVFVGRLVPEKGAATAIEAVARLGGAVRLRLVGDGPERERLEALAREYRITELVEITGYAGAGGVSPLLADAFAMVVPSVYEEPFGIVAVEGALSGLPVIASAMGGLGEIVVDGETGVLVPPGDADAIAAAVRSLLDQPERAEGMGRAGRRRALAHFTAERTVAAYEAIYHECLETGGSPDSGHPDETRTGYAARAIG